MASQADNMLKFLKMAHSFPFDVSDAGPKQRGYFQPTTDAPAACNERKWLQKKVVQQCELSGRMLGDLCGIAVFKIALHAPCPLSQIFYRGVVCFLCVCWCTHGAIITRCMWIVSKVIFFCYLVRSLIGISSLMLGSFDRLIFSF